MTDIDGVNVNVPHSARIYDYWLGGKDNFAVDRAVGEAMIKAIPGLRRMAGENRKFVHRAARDLVAKEGIRQFLDIGTGIPTRPNLHEVAQRIAPEARVVYVDNDPIVLGLVPVSSWRPDDPVTDPEAAHYWSGLTRKTLSTTKIRGYERRPPPPISGPTRLGGPARRP